MAFLGQTVKGLSHTTKEGRKEKKDRPRKGLLQYQSPEWRDDDGRIDGIQKHGPPCRGETLRGS